MHNLQLWDLEDNQLYFMEWNHQMFDDGETDTILPPRTFIGNADEITKKIKEDVAPYYPDDIPRKVCKYSDGQFIAWLQNNFRNIPGLTIAVHQDEIQILAGIDNINDIEPSQFYVMVWTSGDGETQKTVHGRGIDLLRYAWHALQNREWSDFDNMWTKPATMEEYQQLATDTNRENRGSFGSLIFYMA